MVRAKFRLVEVMIHTPYSNGQCKRLVFQPMYDPNLPEDQSFSKATPSGRLEMTVDNPAALEQLTLGKYFYLDLHEVAD